MNTNEYGAVKGVPIVIQEGLLSLFIRFAQGRNARLLDAIHQFLKQADGMVDLEQC
jgi:hypothetical protein